MLSVFSTKQLVEELSKRAGVDRLEVAPHLQTVSIVIRERLDFSWVREVKLDGPCIVLVVTD